MTTVRLDELLDGDIALDPVTITGLSNHLPMTLIAMSRLGAGDERLADYYQAYQSRLVPRRVPSEPISADGIVAELGTGRRYADLFERFGHEIDRRGTDETLDRHLPTLLDGLGGAAFHGVIRLAYALEHGRPVHVAAGLAYLADSFQPVDVGAFDTATGSVREPAELLDRLAEDPHLRAHTYTSGFSNQYAEVSTDPRFLSIVATIGVDEHTQARIAKVAHTLYRATGDFFALHTMTGAHATRIAAARLSSVEDRHRAVGSLARAIAAAYVVIGTPAIDAAALDEPPVAAELPGWDDIAAAAIDHDNEHVIKLAYTCREEHAAWADPSYQATAAVLVELAGKPSR